MVLRTVTEMLNDVGMTSQVSYFWFISLFGNHFTKIHNLMRTLLFQEKWSLSAPVTMATVYKFEICY